MNAVNLWIVLGVIILAAFVVVGVVASRRRAALQRGRQTRSLPGGAAAGDREGGTGVDLLERPPVGADEDVPAQPRAAGADQPGPDR